MKTSVPGRPGTGMQKKKVLGGSDASEDFFSFMSRLDHCAAFSGSAQFQRIGLPQSSGSPRRIQPVNSAQ